MSRFSFRFQEFQEKYVDIAGGRVSDVEISGEFNMEVIGILTGPEKTCRHTGGGGGGGGFEITR